MKKKLVSVVAAAAMTAVLACPVFAAWQPSKTVQEVSGGQAAVTTADGATADVEVALQAKTAADSTVEAVAQAEDSYVKVTLVSQAQAANDAVDAELQNLSYAEKAGEITSTGLPYSDNAKVNLIFDAVTRSTSTTQFLEKMGGDLLDLVTQKVADLAGAQSGQAVTVDDFAPAALFDVTPSAGAAAQMGEGGSMEVELEVPGITADSNVIAIHFLGDIADVEAAQESLTDDFVNATLDYDAEILDAVPGDGTVKVTMSGFSPVLILTQTAVAAAPEATEEPAAGTVATPEPSAEPAQTEPAADNGGSGWVLPAVGVAVVALSGGAAVAVNRKNKQKTTTGSKQ